MRRSLRSRTKAALAVEPVPSPLANPDEVYVRPSAYGDSNVTAVPSVLSYPAGLPGAVNITNADLERLNPGAFLNDTLIEFGLK
jgi:Ulp1 family protease